MFMKNLFYLSVLALAAGLSACASDEVNNGQNYRYAGREGCSDTLVKEQPKPAPVPAPVVYQQAPVQIAQNCGGCPAREYTVRTPVKVVYKNTTYRTVYEPRTFESTSYETRPFNRAEVCTDGHCLPGQQVVPVQQPVVRQY